MSDPPAHKRLRPAGEDGEEEDPAITRFREYLRIPTISATENTNSAYESAVKFLVRMAEEDNLPCKCIEVAPERVVVVMTWEGTCPKLKSVMLNSHYDVVPVFPECWSVEPFSAHKNENGDIFARGSQDMKCCGMWYLEAIRRLKAAEKQLLRTIHVTFVPDEEIGGVLGMGKFVQHEEFKRMNVGFGLDEGLANPTEAFTVYNGERCPWWFTVTCPGNPGHGSRFIENTAAEKMHKVVNSFLSYRDTQQQKLKSDSTLKLGDVTSLNLTKVQGGVQFNVVPCEMSLGFDIRVTPRDDPEALLAQFEKWVKEAGEGCTISFSQKVEPIPLTSTDLSDPWWNAFSTACSKNDMQLEVEIFPAATDSRFLRELGIPALGFSAMNHTPILLHDHNEFLNERVFLRGIGIYEDIITALGNVEDNTK